MSDLISIITTCYNEEAYIAEAIESVLAQTHTNWELLIFDDGSTDSSLDIIQSYIEQDARISLHQLEKNLGGGEQIRHRAIPYTKGAFITFLDGDDCLTPDSLKLRLAPLHENTELLAVFGSVIKIEKGESKLFLYTTNSFNLDDYIKRAIPVENWCYLYRKDLFDLQPINFPFSSGDTVFTYFLFQRFAPKITGIPEVVYHYRKRQNSLSRPTSKQGKIRQARDYIKVIQYIGTECDKNKSKKETRKIKYYLSAWLACYLSELIKNFCFQSAYEIYNEAPKECYSRSRFFLQMGRYLFLPETFSRFLKRCIQFFTKDD